MSSKYYFLDALIGVSIMVLGASLLLILLEYILEK